MSESGHGAPIVRVTDTHNYELDEHELEQVLMNEEVKDLPVVVVSVAGAYRLGKSFLLNFFIRYLSSTELARQDGSWLGEDSAPLVGFNWHTGANRTTMGILMWSKPFIMTTSSGNKIAVLLVDTQGTFDSKSTVRDCSTIFALSTLVSSVQIYNLSLNIQEDDLQHLQLFTEYGKMVKDQGGKAFQMLEFLVRDWQFYGDYPFGEVGGELLLKEKLEITPDLPKEMQELRQHIRSSFEKVSCFLMPHPGLDVLEPGFDGSISDIRQKFRFHLKNLLASLFAPDKLMPKMINGEQIKTRDLFQYFKTYMTLFNSDTIPNPTSIMKATVEAGLLSISNEARQIYEKGMDLECGPDQPSVTAADLKDLHQKYLNAARSAFLNKKKMGSKEEANKRLEKLVVELEKRLPQFVQSNLAKIQAAINKAKESYEEAILNVSKNQPLCVHPLDLENVHREGVKAATKVFDEARRVITNKPDDERTQFIQGFEKRYDLLRLSNKQQNEIVVSLLSMEYWQYMQGKSNNDPPLSDEKFKSEDENERSRALAKFALKRNIPSHYTEDVYQSSLITTITASFDNLKEMNKSKNKRAMQKSVAVFDKYMKPLSDGIKEKCLHPYELEREYQNGTCRALVAFGFDGFDKINKDMTTLKEILRQRYDDIKKRNDSANETAVSETRMFYVNKLDDLCRATWWWLAIIPIFVNLYKRQGYYEESKKAAFELFYSKRRKSLAHYSKDPVKENLEYIMDKYYKDNY